MHPCKRLSAIAFANCTKGTNPPKKCGSAQAWTVLKIKQACRNIFGFSTCQPGLVNISLHAGCWALPASYLCLWWGRILETLLPAQHCTLLLGIWAFSCPCEKQLGYLGFHWFFLLPSSFIKNTCFLLSRGLREGGLRFSALNQFRSGTGTFFPAQPSSMWFPASFTPRAAARKVELSRLAFICCEISPVCFFWKKKWRGKQPNNEGFEDTFSAQQSTLCCREVEQGFWMSKGLCCVFS